MGLQEILGIVKVKCEEAAGLQLAGEDGQSVSMLQQVATIINSEFGATDEVAADSPEGDEPPEADEQADLLGVLAQTQKCLIEAEGAVEAGNTPAAREHLLRASELLAETLATESS